MYGFDNLVLQGVTWKVLRVVSLFDWFVLCTSAAPLRTAGLAFLEKKRSTHTVSGNKCQRLACDSYGDTPVSAFFQFISSIRCIFTKHYAITSMPPTLVMTYVRECLSLPWIPTNQGIKQLVGTWLSLRWFGSCQDVVYSSGKWRLIGFPS